MGKPKTLGDRAKLPKWAQREMAGLELEIKRLEGCLEVARGDETNISVNPYPQPDMYLSDTALIRFKVPSLRHDQRFWLFVEQAEGGEVRISGTGPLSISSSASNVFVVRPQRSDNE